MGLVDHSIYDGASPGVSPTIVVEQTPGNRVVAKLRTTNELPIKERRIQEETTSLYYDLEPETCTNICENIGVP